MISVQNHLQQLNGNKIVVFLFIIFSLSACNLFKSTPKTPSNKRSTPKVDQPEKDDDKPKIDTIEWTISNDIPIFTDDSSFIEDDIDKDIDIKSHYDIALLIPLYSNRTQLAKKNENIQKMLHFVQGIELVSRSYTSGSPSIDVHVIDVESHPDRINQLMKNQELENFDVIIGPYKTEDLQVIADYSKSKEKVLISPWNSNSNIVEEYNSYIQWKPGLEAHCERQVSYLADYHSNDNIIFITDQSNKEWSEIINFYVRTSKWQSAFRNKAPNIWSFDSSNADNVKTSFRTKLSDSQSNILVMPYWSDLSTVSDFLTQLRIYLKSDQEVIIIGFPQWLDSEDLDFTFFNDFEIKLSYHSFIDPEKSEVSAFKHAYLDMYKTLPLNEAFIAADLMVYITEQLSNKGLAFTKSLTTRVDLDLFQPVELHRVIDYDKPISDRLDTYKYLENKSIQMIEYFDSSFRIVE